MPAGKLKNLQQIAVARIFDDDRIARAQQRAHDEIECLRRARRQQHVRCGVDRQAVPVEMLGDPLAQRREAIGMPVVGHARGRHAAHGAQRVMQPAFVDPLVRQPPAAGLDRHRMIGEDV
jgi:hypothetical protein